MRADIPLVVAALVLTSCGPTETTGTGLALIQQSTSEFIPAEVRQRLVGVPRREISRSVPVGVGNDAEVEARCALVRDPGTRRSYVAWVRLVVAQNDRYQLHASPAEAAGTRTDGDVPIMTLEYTVTWSDPVSGDEGSRRFLILSDGRLDLL